MVKVLEVWPLCQIAILIRIYTPFEGPQVIIMNSLQQTPILIYIVLVMLHTPEIAAILYIILQFLILNCVMDFHI